MAFCSKCGSQLADNAAFCPGCGQTQGTAPLGAGSDSGLSENAAGTLSYLLGWLTGLIFLLIDKRPNVRFHAAQSLVVFGGIHILRMVLASALGIGLLGGGLWPWRRLGMFGGIFSIISLASLVLWVFCMIKASQGERFKLPIAGDLAEQLAGK